VDSSVTLGSSILFDSRLPVDPASELPYGKGGFILNTRALTIPWLPIHPYISLFLFFFSLSPVSLLGVLRDLNTSALLFLRVRSVDGKMVKFVFVLCFY